MKKELFAGAAILLLLVAAISNVLQLSRTISRIDSQLEKAAYAVDIGDYAYALQEINSAHRIWAQADTHTQTLLRHADIDAIMESFHEAASSTGQGEYYPAKYALETLRSRLDTLLRMEKLSLHSVF